ncbi:MAG TPA: hypothetical protein VFQ12_06860, partial [Thermoleophilaceae bacterium]|nr:hypothetical protein [Thermoleophilaceae bacterium]
MSIRSTRWSPSSASMRWLRRRSEHRRSQRIQALDGLQRALGMETIPMRIECFDISNLMGDHTVASMV